MSSTKDLAKAQSIFCLKKFSVAKHEVKALAIYSSGSKDKSRLPLGSQTGLNFGNK